MLCSPLGACYVTSWSSVSPSTAPSPQHKAPVGFQLLQWPFWILLEAGPGEEGREVEKQSVEEGLRQMLKEK